jgi:hypothetical protein
MDVDYLAAALKVVLPDTWMGVCDTGGWMY